ncbi:MAG TPA: hypothetical protein VJV78_08160 [Polyangiales bacterium]|nr:hypothetical protein [Polyangiales bacterium]
MSSDDALMNALGNLAREQGQEAERLEKRILQGGAPGEPGTQPLTAAELGQLRGRLLATAREQTPAPVVQLRARKLLRAMALAMPLCAAAAALLWLRQPASELSALPEYSLEIANAPAQVRSGDGPLHVAGAPVAVRDSLRLVLRPATTVTGAVTASASLQQGAQTTPWPVTLKQSSQGAVQVELQRSTTAVRGSALLTVSLSRGDQAAQSWELSVELLD